MEADEIPPKLKVVQPYARYFASGLAVILGILLFVPQIREPLDIKFKISKDMFLSLWQIVVLIDLLFLFPCLVLRGETKFPILDKFTKQ